MAGPQDASDEQFNSYEIKGYTVVIGTRGTVLRPTPYTLFLAEHIDPMLAKTVADIGTGCGILGIIARMQGATTVYATEISRDALAVAAENAERNGVSEGFTTALTDGPIFPLADEIKFDVVICNPAQLPMRKSEVLDDPFFAGGDGRGMIEALIRETPQRLKPSGRLLMTHNSLTDMLKSRELMESVGLEPRVVAQLPIEFRSFIDRTWIDELGGTERGLYEVRDGVPFEILHVLEARLK